MLWIPPRGKTLLYFGVFTHFCFRSVLGLHNISVQIIMRWTFQLFDPAMSRMISILFCRQSGDASPEEDRGGEHSAGSRRSDTLHNTWQQLPKVELSSEKLCSSFSHFLPQPEMSPNSELENRLQKFLQEFSFASRHASANRDVPEETKSGSRRQKTFHALVCENLQDWF